MRATHSPPRPAGARFRQERWPLKVLLVSVELLALGLTVLALTHSHPSKRLWELMAVLIGMAILFEETSLRVGRLRLLISDEGPLQDMTSVWTFAAALTFPTGYAALFAAIIAAHTWIREQRIVGQLLYRRVYTMATIILACLAAGTIARYDQRPGGGQLSLPTVVFVIGALIVYTATNRLLIVAAMVLSGLPPHRGVMLGSWDDNALELATLCLGYMTAAVLVRQPLLAITSIVPMVLLQRAALVKQLEHVASTDTKTQLLNPLAWRHRAERELSLARSGHIALLVLDLDDFKSVNDLHGHLVGDAALLATSVRITAELRPSDIVGRFGGEEFVVLLPGLNAEAAMAVAERLRVRIAAIRLAELRAVGHDGDGCEHTLSTSIGVAVFPDDGEGLPDLLAAADKAVYAAKRAGRNTVIRADRPDGRATADDARIR